MHEELVPEIFLAATKDLVEVQTEKAQVGDSDVASLTDQAGLLKLVLA